MEKTVKPFEDEPASKRSLNFQNSFTNPRPHRLLEIREETKIWEKFVEEDLPGVGLEKCPEFPPDTGIPQEYLLSPFVFNRLFCFQ